MSNKLDGIEMKLTALLLFATAWFVSWSGGESWLVQVLGSFALVFSVIEGLYGIYCDVTSMRKRVGE